MALAPLSRGVTSPPFNIEIALRSVTYIVGNGIGDGTAREGEVHIRKHNIVRFLFDDVTIYFFFSEIVANRINGDKET